MPNLSSYPAIAALHLPPTYDAHDFGVKGDGVTDDTANLLAAIALIAHTGGGILTLSEGVFNLSAPLTLNGKGVVLAGAGAQTVLRLLSTFTGSNAIILSADYTGVQNLTIAGASTTYSANPAADGIQVTGARNVTLSNLWLNYLNGWAIQSTSTSTVANSWLKLSNVYSLSCAQGLHILGHTGTSYAMSHALLNCTMDQVQNGDAYLFEDSHDVLCTNLFGSVTAGSGNSLHIKGACAALYLSNLDLGPNPGPATGATVLVESGSNGTPTQIVLHGGILQGGLTGLSVTAATELILQGLYMLNNGTHGILLSGSSDAILVKDCLFDLNGATAASANYDLTSSTTGHVLVQGNYFKTAQGTTAQHTAHAINVTAGNVLVQGNQFTTAAPFAAGLPKVIRGNPGYNPVGNFAPGSIGTSPFTLPASPHDVTYYVTGGTVSDISIGGTSTGLTSGAFRVSAQQTLTITHTGAPTVTAFAD